MANKTKCPVCGEYFDRDMVKSVVYNGKRWAHYDCAPDKKIYVSALSADEIAKAELIEYIKHIHNVTHISPKITKEIKQFHDDFNYTYTGMRKSLQWFYEIERNPVQDKYKATIGIMPHIYHQASVYFSQLYLAQHINDDKKIEDYKPKTINIKIKAPMRKPATKLFNLDD